MSAHQVQQLLVKSQAKYVDSAKSDILGALREFSDLTPDSENYMYPDGKRRPAFFLRGTIPVHYKGSCYNIPVAVYLWDTHPYYAPICYVRPTNTMMVKESETVNKEGRIFLPYLNEWRFPGYDLNGLLQVMAMVFQERCPVFAKTSQNQQKTSTSAAPAATPYPANPSMPTPYPNMNATPYPATTPYPNVTPGQSPYMNVPYFNNVPAPARPAPPVPSNPAGGTMQQDHIKASLQSALENKIKIRLRERLGTEYAEMASITQTKRELQSGQHKLRKILDELNVAKEEMDIFIRTYTQKKDELMQALPDESSKSSDIDSAIDATTPLHKQLLLNYAQELACEDVIYAIGQARTKGALSLQEYLKHVRNINRRQFQYRATMHKCRRTAGLPL